jgi:hypothetical protein
VSKDFEGGCRGPLLSRHSSARNKEDYGSSNEDRVKQTGAVFGSRIQVCSVKETESGWLRIVSSFVISGAMFLVS